MVTEREYLDELHRYASYRARAERLRVLKYCYPWHQRKTFEAKRKADIAANRVYMSITVGLMYG